MFEGIRDGAGVDYGFIGDLVIAVGMREQEGEDLLEDLVLPLLELRVNCPIFFVLPRWLSDVFLIAGLLHLLALLEEGIWIDAVLFCGVFVSGLARLAVENVVLLKALLSVGSFFGSIKDDYFFPLDVLLVDIAAILCSQVGFLLLERFL